MSRRKRESSGTMPASSAGLMRFFQDEANGIKIRPEVVMAWAATLIAGVIMAHLMFPTPTTA